MSASDVEQRVLKERLQSVLLHKLVKSKEVIRLTSTSEDYQVDETALQSLVTLLTSKTVDKDMGKVDTSCFYS